VVELVQKQINGGYDVNTGAYTLETLISVIIKIHLIALLGQVGAL